MTTDPVAQVRHAFESVGRGDLAPLTQLLADDVRYTLIGSTPVSGTHQGRAAVARHLFGPLTAALAGPLVFSIERLLRDGDWVVMQAQGRARLRSGAPYDNVYCLVFRFADGAVREVTEYLDTGLVQRAFAVPPTRAGLLRAMDLNCWEMYREITRGCSGSEILDTPTCTLLWSPRGTPFHNAVLVREPLPVDELLDASRRFHGARRAPASVWVRAHADQALEDALRAHGYVTFTSMPGMALLGDPGTPCAPEGLTIRAAVDDRGRDDFRHVSAEAYATYGAPPEYAADAFAQLESVCAPHVQGFVGYAGGASVAAAALYLTHGVAGIGWVGCVPEARGRRFAEAVTWRALREGFRRGASFANLQASPMGRPVYERMGFATLTEYRVLVAAQA
ncbi:MAG TPA: nuclear transport factor 2 family protein [Candidatus Dormibacteraeota bacterium]|nr:nuclear transport factor 2 family protein [Candidatus Dormibacteraeota bacterium]